MTFHALFLALLTTGLGTPRSTAPPSAGFSEAHVDAATLRGLLGDREATGLRIYNVQLPSGTVTAMVVGIRADGTELKEGLFASPYKACAMNAQDPLAVVGLSRNEAESACERLAGAGTTSFSSSIPAGDVLALLDVQGAMGVRITPVEGASGTTFQLMAVRVDRGIVQPVGEGGGSTRSCGDPCPVACGPPSNYINEAVMGR